MRRTIFAVGTLAALALVAGCNDNKADGAIQRGTSSGAEPVERTGEAAERGWGTTKDAADEAGGAVEDKTEGRDGTLHEKVESAYDEFGRRIDTGKE
jgi:hypothetical protein